MPLQSITFGSEQIKYYIEYSQRKTLEINVFPDLSVKVKAPLNSDLDKIQDKVRQRAYWIIKKKDYFASFIPEKSVSTKVFKSGENCWYLGKQYRLKLIEGLDEGVKLKQGYLHITVKDKANHKRIDSLMDKWYRQHAKAKFKEKLILCYVKMKKYGIELPPVKIMKMSKRWGSYTKSGNILLNSELIKAPSHCIEYVIMHELCHVKFNNHNRSFYNFLAQVMPDYQKRKDRLELSSQNILNR
ncbi:M48 family peptidase [bacterium]|nr:MAG: M48 family peptidase [bacterium]